MAVAYDNSTTTQDFGVTDLGPQAITISGSNRAACIGLTALANISSETASCGGVSGSKIASTDLFTLGLQVMLFSVTAPASGSQTYEAHWTTAASASAGVITLTGVDQTTPANNGVTKSAAFATSISQAVTSNSGDMTVTMYAGGGSDGAATSNQTKRTSDFGAMDTGSGAATPTHTWSHAAEDMVFTGANFQQVTPPSAAITGTATASITEQDIRDGGKTVIVTLTADTYVPASVIGDVSFVNNALGGTTTTTSFSITLPATEANDIIILEFCHRGTGNGTIGGTYTGPAFTLKHSQTFNGSAFSGKTYYSRATGNHTGETVTGSSLTNSCAAIVTIYRGAVTSGDPLSDATVVGEENASADETQAEITTGTNKAWVVLVVVNSPDLAVATQACTSPGALTERAERLSTGGTDSSIAHASAAKATAGATGAFTWTQTDAASGSWAYAIKPNTTTPFDTARQAFIDGFDSAQSEGTGWNAEVRDKAAVTEVVRTSDTVATWTIAAQAGHNITAQETITGTIPASILTSAAPITATPTFTIAVSGAAAARFNHGLLLGVN